jgi:hypothetical protein
MGSALHIGKTQGTPLHIGTRDMVFGDWRDLMTGSKTAPALA